MRDKLYRLFASLALVLPLFALLPSVAVAEDQLVADEAAQQSEFEKNSPHWLIDTTADALIDEVLEAQNYFDDDPERFYDKVRELLEPLVDFYSFTRSVMGPYGSKKYEARLNKQERQEFLDQINRFSETFKSGLIRTYGKGLLAFSGNKIEVEPPVSPADRSQSVNVKQIVYGEDGTPYDVFYKFRYSSKHDGWKLRNVTIDSVNLGKVYRSQFISSMKEYNKDINKVIDNWSVEAQNLKEERERSGDDEESGSADDDE